MHESKRKLEGRSNQDRNVRPKKEGARQNTRDDTALLEPAPGKGGRVGGITTWRASRSRTRDRMHKYQNREYASPETLRQLDTCERWDTGRIRSYDVWSDSIKNPVVVIARFKNEIVVRSIEEEDDEEATRIAKVEEFQQDEITCKELYTVTKNQAENITYARISYCRTGKVLEDIFTVNKQTVIK